jgi:chromosomal replication initiation ATPase DnaA
MNDPIKIHYINAGEIPTTRSAQIAYACDIAGISVACCLGKGRHRDVARRRWHVMAILHERGWSSAEIGRRLNRDHSTVLHGLARHREISKAAA